MGVIFISFLYILWLQRNYFAQVLPRKMKIKDTTGKSFSLRAVFKESIRFFKEHALGAITRKTTLLPTDMSWVLTIPAIWSEPAKQFMRTAAEEVQLCIIFDDYNGHTYEYIFTFLLFIINVRRC